MTDHPLEAAADYSEAPVEILARADAAGERLDKYLAARLDGVLEGVSRSRLQQWIALGAVEVDGVPRAAKSKLSGIERIVVRPLPRDADRAFEPDPVPLSLLHEDADLAVIDKPAGLVVHPAAGNWRGTLMNGLLHRWPDSARLPRAGIVHRLDKDTSGLMVVARSDRAVASLVAQLSARTAGRSYLALAEGDLRAARIVDAPIGRDASDRTRMAAGVVAGKPARTRFQPIAGGVLEDIPVTLVLCRLETGRTHQIRVHLRHLGFPIVGDATYGRRFSRTEAIDRQALHAWRLELSHPADGRRMGWSGSLPPDMARLLERTGIDAGAVPARADALLRAARAEDAKRAAAGRED